MIWLNLFFLLVGRERRVREVVKANNSFCKANALLEPVWTVFQRTGYNHVVRRMQLRWPMLRAALANAACCKAHRMQLHRPMQLHVFFDAAESMLRRGKKTLQSFLVLHSLSIP